MDREQNIVLIETIRMDFNLSHRCEQCDYVARNISNLNQHLDAIHKKIYLNTFMCDRCDYSTKHKSNLNSHKKANHEMRVFSCSICETKTKFKQFLQKHMREKHDGKTVYFCSHCHFSSEIKQEYSNHKTFEMKRS